MSQTYEVIRCPLANRNLRWNLYEIYNPVSRFPSGRLRLSHRCRNRTANDSVSLSEPVKLATTFAGKLEETRLCALRFMVPGMLNWNIGTTWKARRLGNIAIPALRDAWTDFAAAITIVRLSQGIDLHHFRLDCDFRLQSTLCDSRVEPLMGGNKEIDVFLGGPRSLYISMKI